MKLYFCNRCGSQETPLLQYAVNPDSLKVNNMPTITWPIDLCPRCTKELHEWFNQRQAEFNQELRYLTHKEQS